MRVETITCMYNEEFLAPLYLKHYDWVDQINILFDCDSDDETYNIIKRHVNIIPFKFDDGMDDLKKVEMINEWYSNNNDADWILNVDADEFIFNQNGTVKEFLSEENENINTVVANLWNVYRNIKDNDIDRNDYPLFQRRHGDPDMGKPLTAPYKKPIVVRNGFDLSWGPGNHSVFGNDVQLSDRLLYGTHWANADPCFCIERRVRGRSERQSKVNLENKLTWHQHNLTEEKILAECKQHETDPQLF